jgi:hypothetical protein
MPVSLSRVLISFYFVTDSKENWHLENWLHYFSKCKSAPHYFSKCKSAPHYFSKSKSAPHSFSKSESALHYLIFLSASKLLFFILDASQRLFFILLSMKQCPIFVSKQFHISLFFLDYFEYVSNAIYNYVQNF